VREHSIAVLVGLALAGCGRADDPSSVIRLLAERWRVAEMSNDAIAVESLLHETFIYVGPTGDAFTREQDLAAIADPSLQLGSFDVSDVVVDCVASECVERGIEILTDAYFGELRLDGRYRYVTIWRKYNGDWKAVYAQETKIAA